MTQGSPEWFRARSVHITASRFGDVMARPETKRYRLYQQEKINEILGAPYMSDDPPWFAHGKELEPHARDRYEFEMAIRGQTDPVEQVFFVKHPEHRFIGASPDGHIPPNKGLEIKSSIVHSAYIKNIKKGLPAVHKPQVQGQMLVCGYESVDFVCFFRDPDGRLPDEIFITNVLPDKEYQQELLGRCLKFWDEINFQVEGSEPWRKAKQ